MRIRFWGTRGSIPSPGPRTVRYGGNTPCLELRTADDHLIVVDAGTGVRELGQSLLERSNGTPIRGDLFVTHTHWDHIQGLPFFAPAFRAGNHFTVWGSEVLEASVARVVRDQMSPVVFPVSFEQLGATFDFRELGAGGLRAAHVDVRAIEVCHPGGALGYRFAEPAAPDRALVYISDNELRGAPPDADHDDWRARLVDFVRGARVLVHDAMYTEEEYAHHRGWGHSTFDDAVRLAADAGVATLVLFHHSPDRGDDDLERHVAAARALAVSLAPTLAVLAAAEGMELEV